MKSRGVPIDGVGHQMHNNVDFPSGQAVVNAIDTIHALGVDNSVTELDISVYSGSFSTPVADYTNIPPERFVRQGYRNLTFFQAFKQLQGKIKSVTFWGKADDQTWLTSSGRVDGPLLFDVSFKKKHAYWAIVDPLQLPGADLSTTMTAAPTTVAAGQGVTYTITVTNNADTDTASFKPTDDDLPAAAVSLTTAVPAHTVLQSLVVPAGWSCAAPPTGGIGPVQCTIATLPAGASATFTLTVSMADCAAANGLAIAASANVTSTTADPNPAPNNAASAAVSVSNSVPVITAAGPLDTTVECATSFVDPGATATDACEGPVAVTTTGTVDVSQVATYAIRYDAVDQAGGHATPVTRTVHVTDTIAPVVSVVGANPAAVECATAFMDPGATATDSCAGAARGRRDRRRRRQHARRLWHHVRRHRPVRQHRHGVADGDGRRHHRARDRRHRPDHPGPAPEDRRRGSDDHDQRPPVIASLVRAATATTTTTSTSTAARSASTGVACPPTAAPSCCCRPTTNAGRSRSPTSCRA